MLRKLIFLMLSAMAVTHSSAAPSSESGASGVERVTPVAAMIAGEFLAEPSVEDFANVLSRQRAWRVDSIEQLGEQTQLTLRSRTNPSTVLRVRVPAVRALTGPVAIGDEVIAERAGGSNYEFLHHRTTQGSLLDPASSGPQ